MCFLSIYVVCAHVYVSMYASTGPAEGNEGHWVPCANNFHLIPHKTVSVTEPGAVLAASEPQWSLSLLPTQLGSRYIVATSGFLCGGQWFKVRAKCLCCECPYPLSHLHKPLGNYFYLNLLSPVMSLHNSHVVLDSRDGMRAWSHGWLHICSLVCNVASVTRQWFRVFPVVSWRGRKTQCAFSPRLEMVTENDDLGVASQSIGRAMKEERAGPD